MLLWQCEVEDVCKLGFTLRTFLGCAWGGSWKGKHEKTYHLHPFALHVDSLNIHFAHPLKINRNAKNPIDPDHPWPSRTPSLIIPDISRMQLWSRVCVSCPVQVWSFRFVQPVSLSCMTTVWWYSWWSLNFGKLWSWFATLFFQYAWFCIWDASNGFFETLDARLSFQLFFTMIGHNLAGNPIRPLRSHKRRPGMHEVERSVFSVFLLRLLTVICHLQRPGAAVFFFYQTLEVTKTDPNAAGFQIPGKDFPDNFPSQLRVLSFLCDRCTQRPLDVGGEPGSEARDWFIATSLCISNFWKMSWSLRFQIE